MKMSVPSLWVSDRSYYFFIHPITRHLYCGSIFVEEDDEIEVGGLIFLTVVMPLVHVPAYAYGLLVEVSRYTEGACVGGWPAPGLSRNAPMLTDCTMVRIPQD